MKKENYTKCQWAKNTFAIALFFLFAYNANAQCTLACNNNVQVSLDNDCTVTITPDMVLEGMSTTGCSYTVTVKDLNNVPIPTSPDVGAAYIGQTLIAEISEGGNSCWGYLTLEDKLPPVITCPADLTLSCYQINNAPVTVFAQDNCQGQMVADVLSDVIDDVGCTAAGISAIRTITYGATDQYGNVATPCSYTITYSRITIPMLTMPLSYDGTPGNNAHIECGTNLPLDSAGNPAPSTSGTQAPADPSGALILPNNTYCELSVTYNDQVLDICESSKKVIRYWTILDWCTGEVVEHIQIIKIMDTIAPNVSCPPVQTISTDPYACSATYNVVAPTIFFDCTSTTWTVQHSISTTSPFTSSNVTGSYPNFVISDLPLGRSWVKYLIEDDCGNITECTTEVDVEDEIAPVPVCDQFTAVTLSSNGRSHVFAESFDDGSHDNCSAVTFGVRRMNTNSCSQFSSTQVFNNGGTIYYDFVAFCCQDVSGPQQVELIVIDSDNNVNVCMVTVTIEDKEGPTMTCPTNLIVDCTSTVDFGTPEFSDNCGAFISDTNTNDFRNSCGVGNVIRTWTVSDGGGMTTACSQVITYNNQTPFNGATINFPSDRLNIVGCAGNSTEPSVTGEPTYNGDNCSLVAHTYSDQVFNFVDNACFKILRTWTVIDWCVYNNGTAGIWSDVQVIKVNDDVAPVINMNNASLSITANCTVADAVTISATDACGSLDYAYQIQGGASGNTNSAFAVWSPGTHFIDWSVSDMCGNVSNWTQTVTVSDTKKPTPYCLGNITTVLMPTTGNIAIWADDYDLGSFDNCSDVVLSFSSNVNNTSMTFDCDDVGINLIEIWVTDASGNQDFCQTTIDIQDPNGTCPGSSSRIAGTIKTEINETLEDAEVMMDKLMEGAQDYDMTDNVGKYNFSNMALNATYNMSATKNDDYMNGVSTLDLVLIQKHILSIKTLDSPYKVIAADVNSSGTVTAIDLVELRKLILGITPELPNNGSWRFVDASQTFADPTQPWPFTEEISVSNLQGEVMGNDFVAVKIGDVNGTATANATSNVIVSRSGNTLDLATKVSNNEDLVSIAITADNFTQIVGWQATLDYDTNLEFVGVQSGDLEISTNNLNTTQDGTIAMSWDNIAGLSLDKDAVLFTLEFRAKTNDYNNTIELNSNITQAEAYTIDLELMEINMRNADQVADNGFEVFQNTPNPFEQNTQIRFNLPEDASVTMTIFGIDGRVINTLTQNFDQGINAVEIDTKVLNHKGVMYYRIDAGSNTATRKMISL